MLWCVTLKMTHNNLMPNLSPRMHGLTGTDTTYS